jgi:hypothetical protein
MVPSSLFLDNVRNANLSGNVSGCPNCGGPATVVEGTFDIADGLVSVLSAPDWTLTRLRELQAALQAARAAAPDDPEKAVRLVEEVEPSIGQQLRAWYESQHYDKLMMALGVIIPTVFAVITLMKTNDAATPAQVHHIVEQTVKQMTEPSSPPAPPWLRKPQP